jgi:hypothetical protein
MNTAIRVAIAAAFGVATVLPAFAQQQDVRDQAAVEGQPSKDRTAPMNYHQGAYHRSGMSRLEWSMAESTNEFGSPAGDMATDREIRLGKNSNVGVAHGETVKFITPDGREFRWRFDTLKRITSFPLASISPDSGLSGKVFVSGHNDQG